MDRARTAYDAFRGGFREETCPLPHWDEAPPWIRDLTLVAYLQGKLDGSTEKPMEEQIKLAAARAAIRNVVIPK